jgi:GNAT superfamily N-acetyltransferase
MQIKAGDLAIEIRPGTPEDVPMLLAFIRSMAAFEKIPVTATEEILQDSLFGGDPAASTLFAFIDGIPAAYLIYFYTFSSMVGKRGLWLDDLYVDPAFRGRGVGRALMEHLAGIAAANHCGRFEWTVLDWNQHAIRLYERLGANILSDWRLCRIDEDQLKKIGKI